MGSNLPNRNHFIPQMLLQNFVDKSLHIHVLDTVRNHLFDLKAENAFIEKKRYVQFSDGGQQDDYEVEKELYRIEDAAAPATKQFIRSARKGDCSNLSPMHLQAWKRFFFTSYLRTPENADHILNKLGSEQALDEAIYRVVKEQGLPAPDKEQLDSDPQWAFVKEMLRHNIKASLAAGLPPKIHREIERYGDEVGLLIGVIQDTQAEFIIGSCAAVVIATQGKGDTMTGTWLPISYDVAIGISPFPDLVTLRTLDPTQVQRINNASCEISRFIAARSPSLLKPFMQRNVE